MKGKTCGACGTASGNVGDEYRTPSEQVTKDAISYAHSWVLSSNTCRDPSGKPLQYFLDLSLKEH